VYVCKTPHKFHHIIDGIVNFCQHSTSLHQMKNIQYVIFTATMYTGQCLLKFTKLMCLIYLFSTERGNNYLGVNIRTYLRYIVRGTYECKFAGYLWAYTYLPTYIGTYSVIYLNFCLMSRTTEQKRHQLKILLRGTSIFTCKLNGKKSPKIFRVQKWSIFLR
jgi:hypothetical protein